MIHIFKLGLVSVSFREHSVGEIIEAVKNAGLSCVEWGSDIHAKPDDLKALDIIKKQCLNAEIEICSYGTYFRLGETPLAELPLYINAAKALNTDILRLWCGTKGYGEYTEEEFSLLLSECKEAAKIAEENGVILCMECHNGTVTDCIDGALRLMKEVGSNSFKMYWQPNQYRSSKENIEYAKAIAPYTKYIHIFNWDKENRFPLKDGIEVWKKYLECFKGNETLLLEFMPDNDIKSLVCESNALKMIVGQNL